MVPSRARQLQRRCVNRSGNYEPCSGEEGMPSTVRDGVVRRRVHHNSQPIDAGFPPSLLPRARDNRFVLVCGLFLGTYATSAWLLRLCSASPMKSAAWSRILAAACSRLKARVGRAYRSPRSLVHARHSAELVVTGHRSGTHRDAVSSPFRPSAQSTASKSLPGHNGRPS